VPVVACRVCGQRVEWSGNPHARCSSCGQYLAGSSKADKTTPSTGRPTYGTGDDGSAQPTELYKLAFGAPLMAIVIGSLTAIGVAAFILTLGTIFSVCSIFTY